MDSVSHQENCPQQLKYLDFPGDSAVKNPPAKQETPANAVSLGQEEPLEEEMATHSNILAWEIPRNEEPGGLQSMDCKELDVTQH